LDDSIKHHLVADVPVGIFLSSGLDSSTITALASQGQGQLHSITLGFQELRGSDSDETAFAAKIAARYGTIHQTQWISREDFEGDRQRILEVMGQPATDGVNMYFVAKVAAAAGMKTALSGLGGDELFGGYPSFHDIPRGGIPEGLD
jgi:asparagine synthase (glutamine-hydrolysing)